MQHGKDGWTSGDSIYLGQLVNIYSWSSSARDSATSDCSAIANTKYTASLRLLRDRDSGHEKYKSEIAVASDPASDPLVVRIGA